MRRLARLAPRSALAALAWYAALSVAMTWPLARHLATRIAGDHGDPLLNCWIVGWDLHQIARLLGGDLAALRDVWHGNIFYPELYTLGYSELLFAQAIQALPIHALTGNLVLCYNLLVLASYALSGLGTFLLVREFTGDWRASFVAGLVFGFLPYRADQVAHLQVQSSQWMPFAFYGLRRYFDTDRLLPLAGAGAAIIAQNLSCGYYLLYFSPFIPLYALYEMTSRGRLARRRDWAALAAMASVVAAVTLWSMTPYLALRELHGTKRNIEEAASYAADVYAYLNAPISLTLWGEWLRAYPRNEGALFSGFTAMALAVLGMGGLLRATAAFATAAVAPIRAQGRGRTPVGVFGWLRPVIATAALVALVVQVGGLAQLLSIGPVRVTILGVDLRMRSVRRVMLGIGVAFIAWIATSPRARRLCRSAATTLRGGCSLPSFLAICMVLAWWMSLGPQLTIGGEPLSWFSLYRPFYLYVPGADGLRVPARFAMVVFFFMSSLVGFGTQRVLAAVPRRSGLVVAALSALVLVESAALPYPVNRPMHAGSGWNHPPRSLPPASQPPPVYRYVAALPKGQVVLLEFPIGDTAWDIRYTYFAATHWQHLVNGFSGYAPKGYIARVDTLRRPLATPEDAWQTVVSTGVTHVIVHGDAYSPTDPSPEPWLLEHGAKLVGTFDQARLYTVTR